MPPKFVLDTHAVLWHMTGDRKLDRNAKAALMDPSSDLIFPAIAVAEALFVIQAGKSSALVKDLWDFTFATANVTFYPLDEAVLRKSEGLTAIPEMHDRLIVATALILQDADTETIILTHDPIIQASELVKTLW